MSVVDLLNVFFFFLIILFFLIIFFFFSVQKEQFLNSSFVIRDRDIQPQARVHP